MPEFSSAEEGLEVAQEVASAWIRELQREWKTLNEDFLRGALRAPQLELASDAEATLGSWKRESRRLRISQLHVARDSWSSVVETLKHEMAHQYADEVLRAHDEDPHGPAFRKGCERLRVDPRASARPRAAGVQALDSEAHTEEKVIATIRKLLALGTSSNENEAAAAMRKARSLLHKHKLDQAALEAREGFARRCLGDCKGRHAAWEYTRSSLLTEFFFVEAIWIPSYDARRGRRGSILEIHGRRGDVELAAWVHDWLEDTAGRLWKNYRTRRALEGQRERLRYFDGVLRGFYDKLESERLATESGPGALVPVHDAELHAHFRWLYPRVRSFSRSVRSSEAYHDGARDGRELELRRPLDPRGGAGGSARVLPPPS